MGGTARGNFGLMDQVAALHWIQENIREFNGDERNVTIIGYGHGAACINFLMLSPMARGMYLFMTFFLMKINLIFFIMINVRPFSSCYND